MRVPRSSTFGTRSPAGGKKREKSREDILLQTASGRVLCPNESAILLAETFFPDDDPHHADVRRQTDGDDQPPATLGDLPGVDQPEAEVRNALKAFHPRKAPGIDGFTSDICQAAIFRDQGVFLAMANKCLELGYFPRAWKVVAIKVILKPCKDDYTRPKSYRPIGLLSVLGKTVERMLVGAPPLALKAEAEGDAVWLHAATRDGGRPLLSNDIHLQRVKTQKDNGYRGCVRQRVVAGVEGPAARLQLPSKPLRHGAVIPERPRGDSALR
ncbi:Putative 115 kDa protein in type-1 retrotransposable element R1DM [Eumeta japonica]|uniref:115 kDa protein in type-1 retrotransposable element R1DM n=1 Tax=Eumeta variegata TaxID=151549 RepID=A0A4C1VL32_EUMVA|nr:Putative 115 kDa protein in type-1 retrotransposable element R1DM [Eumeta japonica]